jgi:hypothetical protein
LGVATGGRVDQGLQVAPQSSVRLGELFATTRPPQARGGKRFRFACGTTLGFNQPCRNRGTGKAGGGRYRSDSTPTQSLGFRCRPESAYAFIHIGAQRLVFLLEDGYCALHSQRLIQTCQYRPVYFCTDSKQYTNPMRIRLIILLVLIGDLAHTVSAVTVQNFNAAE